MRKVIFYSLYVILFVFSLAFAQTTPDNVRDLRWRTLGPMRAGWSSAAEGIPDEPDTYYFGGVDGGVWKTTDSGLTWQPISDHAPFSSVGALAIAEGKPRILYVGTGHCDTRYDVMDGTGMFKTEDDGKSWISIGLTDSRHIGKILVDPRDGKTLLVAALGHLFGPNAERGVFRSEDGGQNWKKVLFVDENTGAVDLATAEDAPDTIYGAMWQVRQYPWQSYFTDQVGPGSGIWKSIDGGKTWNPCSRKGLPSGSLSRIGLAVAASTGGKRVYAVVDAPKNGGFYRSDDGGASWQLIKEDDALAGTYFGKVMADPNHTDVVYVPARSLFVSQDGGKNFEIVKGSPGGDDYHYLWINPKHPHHRILASDQGTTVTANNGTTWSPWYNQPTGQFYHLGADNRFPYWVYSGQQDTGSVGVATRSDYGQLTFRDWHPVGADERDYDLPDPEDPNIVYGSGLGGRLSKWDARNGRVVNVSPWPESTYAKRPTTVKYRYTWITPIAISPRSPHALYHGAQVLFRSLDKGKTWSIVSPDLSGADPKAKNCEGDLPVARTTACGYGVIFSIAPSPMADGLIWIGTDNGRIQLTRDDGKTWTNVTPSAITDWSKIATIDASSTDPATAYVAVDRHRMDDRRPYIYRTHDYGKTWAAITQGLPADSWVNVVRQDPMRAGLLYAGTRTGVFVSFNDGDNWQSLQTNLARSGVNDLLIHGNDVVIATQGRAIWILDEITPLRHLPSSTTPMLVSPAKAVRLEQNENRDTPLPRDMMNLPNPPYGAVIDYFLPQGSTDPVKLEILDDQGEVIRSLSSNEKIERVEAERYFEERWLQTPQMPSAHSGHNRFVWNLHYPQPKVPKYEYSIAAVPGVDTPALPRGMLVVPGKYTVRISVGGKTLTQPLIVELDPRSTASQADLENQMKFYREVTSTLASIVSMYKPVQDLDEKMGKITAKNAKEKAESERTRGSLKNFIDAADALTALAVDLEQADGPPTKAQRELYAERKKMLEEFRLPK